MIPEVDDADFKQSWDPEGLLDAPARRLMVLFGRDIFGNLIRENKLIDEVSFKDTPTSEKYAENFPKRRKLLDCDDVD